MADDMFRFALIRSLFWEFALFHFGAISLFLMFCWIVSGMMALKNWNMLFLFFHGTNLQLMMSTYQVWFRRDFMFQFDSDFPYCRPHVDLMNRDSTFRLQWFTVGFSYVLLLCFTNVPVARFTSHLFVSLMSSCCYTVCVCVGVCACVRVFVCVCVRV